MLRNTIATVCRSRAHRFALFAVGAFALGCSAEAPSVDSAEFGEKQFAFTASLPARIEAEEFDRYLDSTPAHQGSCGSGPVDMEPTADNNGICNVGWTTAGEYLEYDVASATTRSFELTARLASANAGKNVSIQLDGAMLGSLESPSAGWQAFADRTLSNVSIPAGNHTIRVTFETGDVNLNYLELTANAADTCGDSVCSGAESCTSCASDCGACAGHIVPGRFEAEAFDRFLDSNALHEGNCGSGPVDQEVTSDSGGVCNVGWTTAGEYLEYDLNVAAAGSYNLTARLASAQAGKNVNVLLDGSSLGMLASPNSGWQSFQDRTLSQVSLPAGSHVLRLVFIEGDVNVNYLEFTALAGFCGDSVCAASEDCSSCAGDCGVCSDGRNIGDRLEAEDNDGMLGLQFENTSDLGGGQNAGWIDAGDYVEWLVNVPAAANYRVSSRSAAWATTGLSVLVDGVLQTSASLNSNGGTQSWSTVQTSAFPVSAGLRTIRIQFTGNSQNLNWIELEQAQAQNELEIGKWRLAAKGDLSTLMRQPAGNLTNEFYYFGDDRQHFRLAAVGNGKYTFAHEGSGQCLILNGGSAALGSCAAVSAAWTLDTLRARTENYPAHYRLRSAANTCLTPNGVSAPYLAACNDAAIWYVESTSWGERSYSEEFDFKSLLIIKPEMNVQSPVTSSTINPAIIADVQVAFRDHLAIWFDRITDGRVRWIGESVVSPDTLTTLINDGGNWLPLPQNMPGDVSRYLEVGKYDSTAVFFKAGQEPSGWGWGPGIVSGSNQTLWVTVTGGGTEGWTAWTHEPIEVFVHEPMHGLDGFWGAMGLPLPDGLLHGAEYNHYNRDSTGFMHWYRDYWQGRVISSSDDYRGYGPRAFRLGSPRSHALN